MSSAVEKPSASLIVKAGVAESLELTPSTENVWIEVIQKMDSVYADLVHYQVELEQKNSALEVAHQFISSIIASMTDVLIVCNTKGTILQVNSALENLTGKTAKSFLQRPLSEIFSDDAKPLLDKFPEKLGNESVIDCEINVLCADGSKTPLAMNCSSRYEYDGGLVGMVLIGRPIGELRRAYDDLHQAHKELQQTQQQLVHSEKMASLGRLVAGVAHELNNPISFVFGNMHALKRYGLNITKYLSEVVKVADSEHLQQLRKELKIDRMIGDMDSLIDGTLEGTERISDIVQDLRRYSSCKKEASIAFDLPSVIEKAVQWVINASRIKPEITFELPETLEVVGHKGPLHQILVNLVQNALDAMSQLKQARLKLSCEVIDNNFLISVMDWGGGIPEQDIVQIFDPFFTSKAVGKGTGLGLYISYGLAQDMGGELIATNHHEGGAVFTLSLPLNGKATA
ncbi:MAG: ATP-binding protein [Pseudomonadota bacterium]